MYKRIVIKVGTKVLTKSNGQLDHAVLSHLVEQIVALMQKGVEVVLVTSGAVGAGRSIVPTSNKKESIADRQVFAAIGQAELIHLYGQLLKGYKIFCAQVLVTKEDFRDKQHYFNMRNCFTNLLRDKVLPIVNENDVTAIQELVFTDNDELAGLVAAQLGVDAAFVLTSVDGVLDGNPKDSTSMVIRKIDLFNIKSLEKYISPERTEFGRGGMLTKFTMARKLASSGIAVHIANGKTRNIIVDLANGISLGTKFLPQKKVSSVKRRIAYSDGLTKGAVIINKCAEGLLISKEKIISLLPIGITKTEGVFEKGEIVDIKNEMGRKIGYGIAQMNNGSIDKVKGLRRGKAVIHYDFMFVY